MAELISTALLALAVLCFLPLFGELDCSGTHAWESMALASLGIPAWCIAFQYRKQSFMNHRRDAWVYGLLLAYELVLVSWHAPLLWGVHTGACWYLPLLHPAWVTEGPVWGWLPVHACLLLQMVCSLLVTHRLKRISPAPRLHPAP